MVQELNFQAYSDRLPPQNIDAEEAILGGILLDPEAIGRVAELLRPEAFYISAHQEIYRAALTLQSQGRPTDLMSITTYLVDHGKLDKVGGQGRIAQLVDRTVSAVNIDQYAQLVTDKYLRRKMIQVGNEISYLGFETGTPLETILDQAEQKVFNITQSRPNQALISTADILTATFSDIESRSLGMVLPGISCGFYDLDAMTQGFQRSDLIIAAGRPAMGKCLAYDSEIVLSDGSVATIEEIYCNRGATLLTLGEDWRFHLTQPSVYVDDGIKPVFRVTTRLGRSIETTLSHPFLTIQGWQRLEHLKVGDRIALPRRIAIFGTETLRSCAVKLLAYLIGDGCLTGTQPEFTNSNPQLQADFSEAIQEFGDLKVLLETSDGTRIPSLRVSSNFDTFALRRQEFGDRLKQVLCQSALTGRALAEKLGVSPALVSQWQSGSCAPSEQLFERLCSILQIAPEELLAQGYATINPENVLTRWLKELNLWGSNAHTKTVPSVIFKLQRSQLALFLNRLFATDGWATVLASGQAQIGYATVSEKLVRQVQHLLLRFGMIAALKCRRVAYQGDYRFCWQLDITDSESIRIFVSEIGIFGKESAVQKVESALKNRQFHANRDLIPLEIWSQITEAKGSESWRALAVRAGLTGTSNIHVGKRAPTRQRLLSLATALEDAELSNLASSEIYWDEIVSIEPMGEKQVYDLTIPETHNFVANDICVHNTSFCLNIARNIAAFHKQPVAIFSLEMSKEQLVYRLLSSEAQIESGRLRSGRISQNEWEPLGYAISALSQMPIFIDDTPDISVTDMRSKVRRLQAENGGAMGLVLIDYLQLMEGSGSENRVQELSKVTRALKGFARELNVPVIALSQLSRGVESRTNKRPMMSDLRESGCLTGDTLVTMADSGKQVPIRDLVGQSGFKVWAIDEATMQLQPSIVSHAFSTGIKSVFRLTTALGRTIRATGNHKFLTIRGWKRLDELQPGDRLALPRQLASSSTQTMSDAELALLGHLIGDGCALPRHLGTFQANTNRDVIPFDVWRLHAVPAMQVNGLTVRRMQAEWGMAHCGTTLYKQNISRDRALRLAQVVQSEAIANLASSDIYWDTIASIEPDGEEEVFDLTVPGPHNFVANNIVVHNSIEQDADLVIMLYRDEYYNPDTPDRGISEIIITKHRNGPVGTVKLLFEPQFTRFRNLATPGRAT
jgi:replicative DNA helicase